MGIRDEVNGAYRRLMDLRDDDCMLHPGAERLVSEILANINRGQISWDVLSFSEEDLSRQLGEAKRHDALVIFHRKMFSEIPYPSSRRRICDGPEPEDEGEDLLERIGLVKADGVIG